MKIINLEQQLEEEMMTALENQDWAKYDLLSVKYMGLIHSKLKEVKTKPYIAERPSILDKISTKARRTMDHYGLF